VITYIDIETNGIEDFTRLSDLKKIHCIAIKCNDPVAGFGPTEVFVDGQFDEVIGILKRSKEIIGHNILGFDLRAIKKILGWEPSWDQTVSDTMILARLCWPDIKEDDFIRMGDGFPKNLIGRHSLEAWGHRIGMHKGSCNQWDVYTPEMGEYCKNDVDVTVGLHIKILNEDPSFTAVRLEHDFAQIIQRQEEHGIPFNLDAAAELYSTLVSRKGDLSKKLVDLFPPKEIKLKTKTKYIPFNPGSRLQIAEGLMNKYKWRPVDFTPDGRPKVDEEVLSGLEYEEAKLLSEYLLVEKRIGQLGDGKEGWMKLVRNGRIHGRVNTNGAVTGRCSHSSPNLAQVPSVKSPFGKECRSLFYAPDGCRMVGVDASGLELRCLAHYMAKYDDGDYVDTVLSGDVHTLNQKAAGLETRDQAKVFIYALVYGAGDEKIGKIIGGDRAKGRAIRNRFLSKVPALKRLKDDIERAVDQRGFLVGLDGRKLKVRSKHSALNTLLQSAGAILVKQATVLAWRAFNKAKIEAHQVAHVHDEIQFIVKEDNAEQIGQLTVEAIRKAGQVFKFRCPLDGEYRVGRNWAETH
jgi:DNA polymerase I-like protein with 3'-5' exonuclease and polymerase domains